MALLTSGQLLPHEFVEGLLELSPAELRDEPFGPLLLLVRLPGKPTTTFATPLEQFTLRGTNRTSLTGVGVVTSEMPVRQREADSELQPDQADLLAELESSVHCVLPLSAAAGPVPVPVGRSRQNAIVLRDDSVSQSHAQLSVHEDGVSVTDTHSKNGTWVNGARITPGVPRWIQAMDRLQFGRIQAFTCTAGVLRAVLRHRLRQLL